MTPLQVIALTNEVRYLEREKAYWHGIQFGEWMRVFTPGDFDHDAPEYPERLGQKEDDAMPMARPTDAGGLALLGLMGRSNG